MEKILELLRPHDPQADEIARWAEMNFNLGFEEKFTIATLFIIVVLLFALRKLR